MHNANNKWSADWSDGDETDGLSNAKKQPVTQSVSKQSHGKIAASQSAVTKSVTTQIAIPMTRSFYGTSHIAKFATTESLLGNRIEQSIQNLLSQSLQYSSDNNGNNSNHNHGHKHKHDHKNHGNNPPQHGQLSPVFIKIFQDLKKLEESQKHELQWIKSQKFVTQNDLNKTGSNIMNTINDYSASLNAADDRLEASVTNLQGEVTLLSNLIVALQSSSSASGSVSGSLSVEDQALLDSIVTRTQTIATNLESLDTTVASVLSGSNATGSVPTASVA